jgi:hypothetical protein
MVVSYRCLSHVRDRAREGTVSYETAPVDAPAEGNVLTCCSKPRDNIVIDL